ncbi:MAG TPA: hypothetical protein VFC19_36005, partial [Candidatus Limnocylindrales bacterium]|nr:hypothetical protein [Candidatus Limnocylindrales bacterium]
MLFTICDTPLTLHPPVTQRDLEAEQVEGLLVVVQGLGGAAPPLPQVAQAEVGAGLPDQVTGLGMQVQGM